MLKIATILPITVKEDKRLASTLFNKMKGNVGRNAHTILEEEETFQAITPNNHKCSD